MIKEICTRILPFNFNNTFLNLSQYIYYLHSIFKTDSVKSNKYSILLILLI